MPERLARWLSTWLAASVLCAAGSAAATIAVRDDAGRTLELARSPQRIVSLLPALTESVCQLGHCHRLVGVDRHSSWPERVHALPRVGSGLEPSIEAVVALRPDLVLMAASARGAERLQALGIATLVLEPRTHADVQRVLRTLGAVLGVDGQQLWQEIEAGLAAAAGALPVQARGWRVYFEVNDAPFAASESSFIGQTLARLGLGNIIAGEGGPFPRINPERVLQADPQLIMMGEREARTLALRPGWRQLRALREGRVCGFTPAETDVLVRPGPRMAEAAWLMVRCVRDKLPPGGATGAGRS